MNDLLRMKCDSKYIHIPHKYVLIYSVENESNQQLASFGLYENYKKQKIKNT